MPAGNTCPDPRSLEQLLLGRLDGPGVERLEEHLTSCPNCTDEATRLGATDTVVEAIRTRPAAELPSTDATLQQLMTRLKELHAQYGATLDESAAERSDGALLALLAPPEGPDEIGRLGPYRLLKVLGTGGMGIVFHAEDTQLKRPVALKVMKPALASNPSARRRFVRESQAAASVKHDHVVTIHQVGVDRGLPFLAMELLEGESLQERLLREDRLPVPEVIRIGREIAQGLAAIHQRGLIHRDIKPTNIWLESVGSGQGTVGSQDGPSAGEAVSKHLSSLSTVHCTLSTGYRVKILDFGIARPEGEGTLTWTDQIVGTPTYIAPEQARGEKVDQRCDLFNLGCVLYRMCTGRLPFKGDTTMAQLTSLAMDAPEPIDRLAPHIPQPLAELILQMLSKDPAGRPASAAAVVDALASMWGQVSNLPADRLETCRHEVLTLRRRRARRVALVLAASILLLAGTWQAAQVIIRIRYPDGTQKDIVAPQGTTAKAIEVPTKAKPNPFDAFQRDQLTTEELTAAGRGDAKDAPAELVGILPGPHASLIASLALHPDGKHLVAGDYGGSVSVWDLLTRRHLATFPGERPVSSLSFSANGDRLAATVWKSGPTVFDPGAAATLLHRTFRRIPGFHASSVALSPGGQRLAASTLGGKVMVWDVDSGQELFPLTGHSGAVYQVAFNPEGTRLATASGDGTVKLWDAATGQNLHTLSAHIESLTCLAFSGQGGLVAAGGVGHHLTIWEVAGGREIADWKGDLSRVFEVNFSPDGSLLAFTAPQQLGVLDVRAKKLVHHWRLPYQSRSVLFAPDGRHLLHGTDQGNVHVLRLTTAEGP